MRKYMNPSSPAGSLAAPAMPMNGSVTQMALARKVTYGMMGVAGALLLIAGGVFYVLEGQIRHQQMAEADKQEQVGSAQQIAKRYDETMADYNATTAQLRYLEKSVATNEYVPTLLPQLQHLAQTYGCAVKSIHPGVIGNNTAPAAAQPAAGGGAAASKGNTGPEADFQIMPLSVSMSGTYSGVMRFIYDLTKFPKVVSVKSIALHPAAASGAPAPGSKPGAQPAQMVTVDLNIDAYVFTPDDAAALAASPGTATAATPAAGSISPAAGPPSSPAKQAEQAASSDDSTGQFVNRPIAAALAVQSASQERVAGAGLQAQPTPPTMPTNPKLGK